MSETQALTKTKQEARSPLSQAARDLAANSGGSANAVCRSAFCLSLPSQLAELSAVPGKLSRSVHLHAPANLTYATLAVLRNQLQDALDLMNDLSETESLRLQLLMDRRSKFISTLSNIMKSIADTKEQVVGNLK